MKYGLIFRQLCNYKGVEIIEGHLYTHTSKYTTKIQRAAIYGIFKRQEQPDDI